MHIWILTLSLFSPEHEQKIIDYFKALNPYNLDIDLLRAEKGNIWNMVYLQNAMLFTPVKMRNSS